MHTYKIFSLKDMVDLFYMNMLVYILDLRYLKFILVLMSVTCRGHSNKRTLGPLGVELYMVMSYHVGAAGN